MNNKIVIENNIDSVYEEINALIQQKKIGVKKVVNDAMVSLYWGIGKRLSQEIIGEHKPEYGKRVVVEISKRLAREYGFSDSMMAFSSIEEAKRYISTTDKKTYSK